MKNNYTVTIGLSAYNEEQNIKSLIESVLIQKEDCFKIKSIWIFSDGSTDKTETIVKNFKDKRIKMFAYKERLGKSARLNIMYKKLSTDFLVQTDADVIFSHENVIKDIIQPLINEQGVVMCGGNPLPIKAKTFTEEAINCTVEAFVPLRKLLNGGNNIFSVDGRLLAYKRGFIKEIFIPEVDVTANDAFTYFSCLTNSYSYRFVEKAVVYFRSPQTLKDHLRQNTRFLAMPIKMSKYFDPKLVRNERNVNDLLIIRQMLKVFIRKPIHCIYIAIVNGYCRFIVKKAEKKLSAKWKIALTTKEMVKI